jgi:hypothetical protein
VIRSRAEIVTSGLQYNGQIIRTSAMFWEIRFPNLWSAAQWVKDRNAAGWAAIRDSTPVFRFDAPVVLLVFKEGVR